MRIFLGSIGGCLFLGAVIAQVVIRVKIRPSDSDEEVYWEFEDQYPIIQRYDLWLKRSFTVGVIGTLFLFLALML